MCRQQSLIGQSSHADLRKVVYKTAGVPLVQAQLARRQASDAQLDVLIREAVPTS